MDALPSDLLLYLSSFLHDNTVWILSLTSKRHKRLLKKRYPHRLLVGDILGHLREGAAKQGNQTLLAWTMGFGYDNFNSLTCGYAASRGQLAIIKWLRDNFDNAQITRATLLDAIQSLDIPTVDYCKQHCVHTTDLEDVWDACAGTDYEKRRAMILYLETVFAPRIDPVKDHLLLARFGVCLKFVESGNLWALEHCLGIIGGFPMDTLMEAASKEGHIHILEWFETRLQQFGITKTNPRVCYQAAKTGRLDTLIWLHKHGYPWDDETTREALGNGHLEVLAYARKNGCPWVEEPTLWACRSRCQKEAIQWLWQNEHSVFDYNQVRKEAMLGGQAARDFLASINR